MGNAPDSPSLEYLRRQAKDLLAGLRETRSNASLADAQAALAHQYGFRTWPELKTEADRRRGRAKIADAAVVETIAKRFGLGTVTAPTRSLALVDEVGMGRRGATARRWPNRIAAPRFRPTSRWPRCRSRRAIILVLPDRRVGLLIEGNSLEKAGWLLGAEHVLGRVWFRPAGGMTSRLSPRGWPRLDPIGLVLGPVAWMLRESWAQVRGRPRLPAPGDDGPARVHALCERCQGRAWLLPSRGRAEAACRRGSGG